MTSEQEEQFKDNGCACRCLIALANANARRITKEIFIDVFTPKYPFWKSTKRCGVTNTGMILDMARELNLADSFQVFINKDRVHEAIINNKVSGVLLFTEKKRETDNTFSDYFHCSLIASTLAKDGRFTIIQVHEDMRLESVLVDDSEIDHMRGYFLLLYPKLDVVS
jgi:hypothetical protein